MTNTSQPSWTMASLREQLEADLIAPTPSLGQWIDGRLVGVLASPELKSASQLALGVSALPQGLRVPVHQHVAEEIAVVLGGEGEIVIGDEVHHVKEGDVILTPSGAPHYTAAGNDQPLLVMWTYAPPGSERRWLTTSTDEG